MSSFIKDVSLFPVSENMTDAEKDDLISKADEFLDELPYCAPFSIKTGDMTSRRYEYKGKFMEFTPSQTGLPTMRDFDVLLYCASWIANAEMEGRDNDVGPVCQFEVEDFLEFSRRGSGGAQYEGLIQGLERLAGSTITTNTLPFGQDSSSFNYVQQYRPECDATGRIKTITLKLPHRMYFLIHNEIFDTYHKDYFALAPTRRLIYAFVKNYCGPNCSLAVSFAKLHEITGATSPLRKFMPVINDLAEKPLPEFSVTIDKIKETLTFVGVKHAK